MSTKKQPPAALVCAGPVSRSALGELPGIFDQIHWIKTRHPSSASRAVRVLGCGRPCREYREIAGASIVIVTAPAPVMPGLLTEMADSELNWKDRIVVLFNTQLDSRALAPIECLGAVPASLNSLTTFPKTLLMEGHPAAVRCIRSILKGRRIEVVELRRGAWPEYLAGVRMGTSMFLPTIAAIIDQFRAAGMQKAAAEKTAAWLFESSIRAYFRAGKRLLRTGVKERVCSQAPTPRSAWAAQRVRE